MFYISFITFLKLKVTSLGKNRQTLSIIDQFNRAKRQKI